MEMHSLHAVQIYKLSKTKQTGSYCNTLIILKWEIGYKKSVELAQNSLKWCEEFASYAHRIFRFFLAQNSENRTR